MAVIAGLSQPTQSAEEATTPDSPLILVDWGVFASAGDSHMVSAPATNTGDIEVVDGAVRSVLRTHRICADLGTLSAS